MKCDELKRHSIRGVMYNGEEICGGFAYYDADEVDAAIAELKAQLESEKASRYAESVDAGMRERRLKSALWLARAERALEKIAWFKLWNASISTMNPEDGARQEFDKWKKALGKFLAKSKEYK